MIVVYFNKLEKSQFIKEYMVLYHGSNVIVQEPQILENGFYKDFGYDFYCTILENNLGLC